MFLALSKKPVGQPRRAGNGDQRAPTARGHEEPQRDADAHQCHKEERIPQGASHLQPALDRNDDSPRAYDFTTSVTKKSNKKAPQRGLFSNTVRNYFFFLTTSASATAVFLPAIAVYTIAGRQK